MTAPACAWPGCKTPPARGRLMCRPDWYRLPKHLRDAILLHYRPGQTALTCSPEYRDALHEVLAYAYQANADDADGAGREPDLRRRQGQLF